MTRLLYVDDSGSEDSGLIVYGWVEVSPQGWRSGLSSWLDLRKDLYAEYGVHVSTELHSTKYLNGRSQITSNPPGRFVTNDGVQWGDLGHEIGEKCLRLVADCPELRIGAVFRRTNATRKAYHQEKLAAYEALVHLIDAELRNEECFGFITMDGEDAGYRDAHRTLKLETRHLIEDPAMHDSRHSQWTQMADLVAYTAYQHLNRHEKNKPRWDWWQDHLAECGELTEL